MIADGADLFDDFDGAIFLNCAYQGPLPRVSAEEVRRTLEVKTKPNRIDEGIYFRLPNRAREAVGRLVGAAPDTITLGPGESHGAAVAALGLDWKPGDRVVLASSDFPSNIYLWTQAARLAGAAVDVVRPARTAATTDEILAAVTPDTRVITVSLVDYGSGEVIDVPRIAEAVRGRDVLLVVDATQAAGAVPLDMEALGASVLTSAGYKWVLGPYGTGFAAIHPDWMERLTPRYVTWTAAEGAENFNKLPREDFRWVSTARRFDAPETASFFNVAGLARSAELLDELGLPAVHAHVTGLLEHIERNLPAPFRRRASSDPFFAPPILSIESDDADAVHAAHARLAGADVLVSLREDGIRVSPFVYNTEEHVETLLRLLSGPA